MPKPAINIIAELARMLPGDALERIMNELEDPGSNLTLGEMARAGAAFSALGARMTGQAKDSLLGVRLHTDSEVLFKWTDPSTATTLDTDAVKKTFPQSEYPELYKTQNRKGSISVELPFSTGS